MNGRMSRMNEWTNEGTRNDHNKITICENNLSKKTQKRGDKKKSIGKIKREKKRAEIIRHWHNCKEFGGKHWIEIKPITKIEEKKYADIIKWSKSEQNNTFHWKIFKNSNKVQCCSKHFKQDFICSNLI